MTDAAMLVGLLRLIDDDMHNGWSEWIGEREEDLVSLGVFERVTYSSELHGEWQLEGEYEDGDTFYTFSARAKELLAVPEIPAEEQP